MKFGHILRLLSAVILVVLSGCGKGLGPIEETTGFSGVISYKNWPPADSILELRIVAFEEYPADSASIFQTLLSERAAIYPHVTTGVALSRQILGVRDPMADTIHYEFFKEGTVLKERTYNYIVLAWRYGPNYFADWSPAGVFTFNPGSFEPAPVIVRAGRMREDVNITVDFHNLPPKPWR